MLLHYIISRRMLKVLFILLYINLCYTSEHGLIMIRSLLEHFRLWPEQMSRGREISDKRLE